MNIEQILHTFTEESRELLADMESALLEVEHTDERGEIINRIFRAAHTIKGSAGLFGLDFVVAFTHVVESVLDRVRNGEVLIAKELVVLLLECCDHIGVLIGEVEQGKKAAEPHIADQGAPLIQRLQAYLASAPTTAQVVPTAPASVATEDVDFGFFHDLPAPSPVEQNWHLSVRFGPQVLRNGMDPLSFINYLRTLGTVVEVITVDAVPPLGEMEPESCYLGFEIALRSQADKATIENVFEFVREDCRLAILPPGSKIDEYVALIQASPNESEMLGEMLIRCGTLTRRELDDALNTQAQAEGAAKIGELLIQQGSVQAPVVEAALNKQKQGKEAKAQESRSIRVDADKLDHLINLVGELIISAASANMIAHGAGISELEEATATLSGLVEEVRDSALQLRMVKIGATFNRFQRVVHDVARELNKDIRLEIRGEDTELDKTVVEKLGDPLTHLVRNSMDHGIESAEVRVANGKPAQGAVKLNAYHDSGSIVIEVSDDGGGLKREKILAKAIERGLVEPGRHLSDSEIYNLIFEPGFSTAEAITNLSGRGVGMDVVKRNIVALRGTVDVDSEEGVGTTVTIRLPLTLAIIDGFMVGLDKSVFVVPLDMIEECVEYSAEAGHDYTNLRGEVLPFVVLRDVFEIQGPPSKRRSIVVVKHGSHKAGLVVDALLGEFQTVIKPLGRMFTQVKCISGSTILGNGDVALILDVPALLQQSSAVAAPPIPSGEKAALAG